MKQSNFLLYLSAGLCQLTGAVPAEISAPEAHIEARHDSIAVENAALDSRQADCRRGLSCSYDYIESQPLSWRQGYLRTIGNDYLSRYNSGNKCRSIEGQISVLIELRILPRSWTSCQNAGLLEALQNAAANINGVHSRDGGNPGVRPWSNYFRKVRAGGYTNKDQHDSDWAACEETSSEYGRQIGERRRYRPSPPERSCYKSSQTYRYLLRNKSRSSNILRAVLGVELGGGLLGGVVNIISQVSVFLNLVINVESQRSGYKFYKTGTEEIGPEDYDKSNEDTVKELGPELYEDFQEP